MRLLPLPLGAVWSSSKGRIKFLNNVGPETVKLQNKDINFGSPFGALVVDHEMA